MKIGIYQKSTKYTKEKAIGYDENLNYFHYLVHVAKYLHDGIINKDIISHCVIYIVSILNDWSWPPEDLHDVLYLYFPLFLQEKFYHLHKQIRLQTCSDLNPQIYQSDVTLLGTICHPCWYYFQTVYNVIQDWGCL